MTKALFLVKKSQITCELHVACPRHSRKLHDMSRFIFIFEDKRKAKCVYHTENFDTIFYQNFFKRTNISQQLNIVIAILLIPIKFRRKL